MSMRLRRAILAGVIAISAVARSANGAETQAQRQSVPQANTVSSAPAIKKIETDIWKLGVLSANSKLSVQIVDKQALVTVYGGDYEKAAAGLLKIDAVLIAKCVFDNVADVVRTKVCFGNQDLRAGFLSQVSVSKGDIKAFGSNQLSKSDLLASLEIVQIKQAGLPRRAALGPGKTTAQVQDPVEVLNVEGAFKGRSTAYRNSRTGLTLSYPSHWKLVEAPDKDTLFKIDASTCSLAFGLDNSPAMPVRQAARLWESLVLSQFENYKLVSFHRLRFGQNRSLEGFSMVVQFTLKGLPIRQRWIFFGQPGSVYHAILSMPEGSAQTEIPDVHKTLMSVAFTGGTIASQKQRISAPQEIPPWAQLALFQEGPISINYPAQWRVKKHPEPEVVVEFSGKTADGDAELQIRRSYSDGNALLEDVASIVETQSLKPLKNYRRMRQEPVSLAGGTQGILQEFTFEAEGLPFRQTTIYRREGDHIYTLSLTASGWKQGDMLTLFNRCLSTWSVRE